MPYSPTGPKRPKRHPRFDYRDRSDESAHANGDAAPVKVPDHPLIPKGAADVVTSDEALRQLVQHLRAAGIFAYDSEFIGELSYYPKLCLIQVATAQRVSLVDALAGLDLSIFWQLIADPALEKIVHAGEQDLEPVHRLLGRPPANVFDIQVAAGLAALSFPAGLSKLVGEMLGVRLGKGFTFTHWDRRPLTGVQLSYAADDVRYLPALRRIVGERLEAMGHLQWAKEECASLCEASKFRFDPATAYLRLRGAASLHGRNAAVLRELVAWREMAAREHNSPPRSYLRDEILVDMARSPMSRLEELSRVKGLPRPVEEEEGPRIIEAIARALAMPVEQLPEVEKVEEAAGERFLVDSLWSAVQAWCHGQSVDPAVVSSRAEIARFCRKSRNGGDAADLRLMTGWRRKLVGDLLETFLKDQRAIRLHWKDRLQSE